MIVLEQIIRLYKEINEIYHSIFMLDLNKNRNNNKYLELIKELKDKLVIEESLLKIFINNYKDESEKVIKDISMGTYNYQEYVSRRLCDYINNYNKSNSVDSIDEDDMEDVSDGLLSKIDILYTYIYKNILLIYLSFLDDYLNAKSFSKERYSILGYKYQLAISNHDIEKVLVDNLFNIPRENYYGLDLMALSLGVDMFLYDEIEKTICFNLVSSIVKEIILMDNDSYNDEYKKINVINYQCLLRATLLVLSYDKDSYMMNIDLINKLLLESNNFNNSVSIDIIKEIIKDVDRDKHRVRMISVRPNKFD